MKLIKLTIKQCNKFSPILWTSEDVAIDVGLRYSGMFNTVVRFKVDVADSMIMKIRTQLPGKPADKEAAVFTALRLQGFI